MSSPWAARPSTCPGRRRAIRGTRAFHCRFVVRHRRGGGGRHDPGRHRLRHRRLDPRARGACAASPASSRPMDCAAARGVLPLSSPWTTPGRWPGPWRTARCCCRRWPATIPPTPPAPTVRSPISPPISTRASKACASAWCGISSRPTIRSARRRPQGIEDALDVFQHLGAEISDVTLSPMADYNACGWVILITEAYAVHEPWLKTRFNDYGELLRDRLAFGGLHPRRRTTCRRCAGAACCAWSCSERWRTSMSWSPRRPRPRRHRSTRCRNGRCWRSPLHHAVQPDRLAGDERLHRLRRRWAAGGMQLVGKPFAEATVFRAGHAYENATNWRTQRPSLAG